MIARGRQRGFDDRLHVTTVAPDELVIRQRPVTRRLPEHSSETAVDHDQMPG